MFGQPTIGLVVAVLLTAQDPGAIPGRKSVGPEKAVEIGEPDTRAVDEKSLRESVANLEKQGADDLRLAVPLQALGVYLAQRQRSAEAEPLLRRALAILEKHRGPNHPDVALALINLSVVHAVKLDEEENPAGPMLARAVAILEKTNREDPQIARALTTMAALRTIRRDFDQAEPMLKRALAIREKTSGTDSPEVASVLEDLGTLHAAQSEGGFAEFEAGLHGSTKGESEWDRHARLADDHFKRALAIYETARPPDQEGIARTVFNLGQLWSIRERWADAAPYMTRWLKLQEAAKAPPSTRQGIAFDALAQAARERKDWVEADRQLEKRHRVYAGLRGEISDGVASAIVERADLAIESRRFDDAEKFLRQALAIDTSILGPKHPDIIAAREHMPGTYRDHLDDRRAPILWRWLDQADFDGVAPREERFQLMNIASSYATLLRQTNRVLPQPTDEDFAYLKKIGALGPDAVRLILPMLDHIWLGASLDDAALPHVGRLYSLTELELRGVSDAGLAHIRNLVNLRSLSLSGDRITDAGLEHLAGLDSLESLRIRGTKVTAKGLDRLHKQRPVLTIDQVDVERALPPGLVPTRPAPEVIGAPSPSVLPGLPRPGGPMPATLPAGPAPGSPAPPR
ncbi:MAG: tetratricopeptide repeat protein [Isosphaeraceae bacterium]